MSENFYRNKILPMFGFYFCGALVGASAAFFCFMNFDNRLFVFPFAILIGALSGLVLLNEFEKEEKK